MKNRDIFAKSLAILGTVLVWIPIIAPLLFSVMLVIRAHIWRFDYLMPAELSLVALLGAALLIWTTIRAHSHRRMIGWTVGITVFLLIGGQFLASVTGLASGAAEAVGWRWALVFTSLVGYIFALGAIGISGLLLIRKLFNHAATSI